MPRNMLRLKFNVDRTVRKRPSISRLKDLKRTYCSFVGAEKAGKVLLFGISANAEARAIGRTRSAIVKRKKVDGMPLRLSVVRR